jgi:PAS domain S-box-containing protein
MGNPTSADTNKYFAQFTALLCVAFGAFIFTGWVFDLDPLTNLVPGMPRVSQLTALGFISGGVAQWMCTTGRRGAAAAVSLLLVAIGLLSLLRYAFGWTAYIDQLTLEPMPALMFGALPPRMAPSTAIAFCCLGSSLATALPVRTALTHQTLAIFVVVIGWLGLSRHVFGGEPLVPFVNVAAHAAIMFILVGAGALTLRTDAGIAKLLASEGVGGTMARRLLPVAILVPLIAGAMALHFERGGSLGYETAVSVFALTGVVAFSAFVLINAARGERADNLRRQAERALRLSEERNQLIVETALDAVITINAHGRVTGWNTQAEKMFGWPRSEAMEHELAELIIPEGMRERHREGLKRYVTTGAARVLNKRIELMALHRDGHEFPVELALTPIGFGDELMFSGFIRDITSRNRAEAALRESEQRFRTTANAAPVMIWMSGPDKRCTWFNQRWLDFVGRAIEQEIGDGWCDNVHPADFDRTLDTYHAAFDARRPYEIEYRLQRDDGAWRWVLERGTPHVGPQGEFVGYIGTCIDITEHRETVEQLRESRARFKTLAESLPQMIWTCLRDGYCDYLSRQWLDYTGRSEAQQVGSGWLEQVHPDDRVNVQLEWARVVGNGDTFDISFRIRRFDGVYRWFKTRAVPLRDPAGRILKWFGSNTDIEDFVLAERKLKVQLERMQLLDQTTHAIGEHQELPKVFDVVLRSLEDNLGVDFCGFAQYHTEPSQVVMMQVGAKSATAVAGVGLREQSTVEVDEMELSRCLKGALIYEPDLDSGPNSPLCVRLRQVGLKALVAAPLTIEDEVFGLLLVARAVPDSFSSDDCEFLRQLSSHVALAAHQARLYGALQGAYQDLRQTQQTVMQQERLRALGQIASGVAHDINNALSPAALYAQSMLSHEKNLSPRARDQLGVIKRAIDDVSRTVQRMRAFYLPQGHELTLSPVEMNPLVAQVIDLTRARWSNMPQERGIVIHVNTELEPDLPRILGAENEVRDALTNLLLNAVDAMPEGGSITFRTRSDRDEHIVVEVQDTGVGMTEVTRSRCLEPFFTTKGERGTGLGLAMVFGMVQRHGGEIEVESELGKGTTMRLIFPSAPRGMTTQTRTLPDKPQPLRVLLIDDDPLLLRSLRDALELDEHEVVTAEGGEAGIHAFADAINTGNHYDVVITDLGMPYVDGRKVAARVRQMSAQVPIIMLTGWGHRLIATDETPEHVNRVLSKPPKMAELRGALVDLVRRNED